MTGNLAGVPDTTKTLLQLHIEAREMSEAKRNNRAEEIRVESCKLARDFKKDFNPYFALLRSVTRDYRKRGSWAWLKKSIDVKRLTSVHNRNLITQVKGFLGYSFFDDKALGLPQQDIIHCTTEHRLNKIEVLNTIKLIAKVTVGRRSVIEVEAYPSCTLPNHVIVFVNGTKCESFENFKERVTTLIH